MSNGPFTDEIIGWAQAAQRVYQIPSSLSLSAAKVESNLGEATPPNSNNWFGIKGTGSTAQTREESTSGQSYEITVGFKSFATPADGFMYYGRLLGLAQPYHDMVTTFLKSARDAAAVQALSNALTGVYATAHNYGEALIAVQKQYNLYQYDQLPAIVPPAKPAAPTPAPAPVAAQPQGQFDMGSFLTILSMLASDIPEAISVIQNLSSNPLIAELESLIGSHFVVTATPTGTTAIIEPTKAAATTTPAQVVVAGK